MSPVRVGSATAGRSERSSRWSDGHIERAVRTRDGAQLARHRVGAGHRDPDRHAAAVVAVTAERAVLVPRQVGDPLDHVERLEQRLDAIVGHAPEHVAVAGEPGESLQAVVAHQSLDRGRHLVEVLHAYEQVVTGPVPRPPRPTVAARVQGRGGVHVARHRGHLLLVEHARRCGGSRRAGGSRPSRRAARRPRSCGRARAARPSASTRSIAPWCVRCAPVERTAQQQPPVEQRVEATDGLVERAVRLHADDRHLIGDEVVELRCRSCAARSPRRRPCRRRTRTTPPSSASVHTSPSTSSTSGRGRERRARRRPGGRGAARTPSGSSCLEARARVDRLDLAVHPAADVDRHVVLPSGSWLSEHGERGIRERRALLRALREVGRRQRPRDLPDDGSDPVRRSDATRRDRTRRARRRSRPASSAPRPGRHRRS